YLLPRKLALQFFVAFLFFTYFYFIYSFNGFILYSSISNFSVVVYPGAPFITSGILLTIVAQVNSTVDGLSTTMLVFGSPSILHAFLSKSSFEYTFPIHSVSIVIPSFVFVVTTALIPVASPAFTIIPRVELFIS